MSPGDRLLGAAGARGRGCCMPALLIPLLPQLPLASARVEGTGLGSPPVWPGVAILAYRARPRPGTPHLPRGAQFHSGRLLALSHGFPRQQQNSPGCQWCQKLSIWPAPESSALMTKMLQNASSQHVESRLL